jgi:hypothetical protein
MYHCRIAHDALLNLLVQEVNGFSAYGSIAHLVFETFSPYSGIS